MALRLAGGAVLLLSLSGFLVLGCGGGGKSLCEAVTECYPSDFATIAECRGELESLALDNPAYADCLEGCRTDSCAALDLCDTQCSTQFVMK